MKKSIAQNLFNLIEEAHFNEEGLELLSQLVNANVVSMTDPVSVNGHKDTLSHALLSLAEPGSQTLHFYTPQAAKQLLALDPKFFSHAYAGAGRLWLDYCLVAWSRSDDGSYFGFSTSSENPADQWAVIAVSSLSDTQKASNELWHAALKLGLPQLAQLLIPHRPDGWTQTDEKGKAIMAKANGGWAWDLAINSGIDPYALTSKGEPFWRAMLPQSSATSPIKGSVRQAVENWVRKEIEKPDSSPELMEYVRKNALAIMSVSSGTNAWARLFHSKQVDYVSTLPAQWVNWHKEGIPAWLKMGMHRDATVAKWLDKIDSRPAWLKEIKSDPLSGLAFEILKAHPNQPNNLNHSVNLKDAFSDPRKGHVIEFVKKLLKEPGYKFDAMIEAFQLQANTDHPPTLTRARPRL